MESPLYVPALKWKQGEHFAVKPLTSAQKARMLPVGEVPDRPYNWEKEKYTKSWEKHLDDVAKATATNWGTAHEIAFDQQIGDGETLSAKPGTPWEYLFESMWAAGVRAVPVLSTSASGTEQAALTKLVKTQKKGRWVLRYRSDPHGHIPTVAQATSWFSNAVAVVGAKHEHVDAVLDLGHITADPKTLVTSTATVLKAVAGLGNWRQVTLLSGAFPVNLAGFQKGTRQIPRLDWDLYKRVSSRSELAGIDLAFGDYGITHVDAFDEDPRKLRMSANLRYTHWKDWHVLKGKNTKDYGFEQYKDLCGLLVNLPIFLGPTFSQGDANYEKVATDPSVGPGILHSLSLRAFGSAPIAHLVSCELWTCGRCFPDLRSSGLQCARTNALSKTFGASFLLTRARNWFSPKRRGALWQSPLHLRLATAFDLAHSVEL